jgi:hypothetical protein
MGHNQLHQTITHIKGIQLSHSSHRQAHKIYTPDPHNHKNNGATVSTTIYRTCYYKPWNAKVYYLRQRQTIYIKVLGITY